MYNLIILVLQLFSVILITTLASRAPKGSLMAWIALQALFANLFVLEPIDLFGFSCSPSDAFAVGSMISLSLLQQQEGVKAASYASLLSMGALGAMAIFSKLHLFFTPYMGAEIHKSYQAILSSSSRLLFASIAAFFISQRLDIKIFGIMTKRLSNAPFALKATIAAFLSQLVDTALFSMLGLYGLVEGLFSIFLISFITKWIVAIFLSFFTSLLTPAKRPDNAIQ